MKTQTLETRLNAMQPYPAMQTLESHCGGNWGSEHVLYRTPRFTGVIIWTGSIYGTFASQIIQGRKKWQACNGTNLGEIAGAIDAIEVHSFQPLLMRYRFEQAIGIQR